MYAKEIDNKFLVLGGYCKRW